MAEHNSAEYKSPIKISRRVCMIAYGLCIVFGFFVLYFRLPKPIPLQQFRTFLGIPILISLASLFPYNLLYKDDFYIDRISVFGILKLRLRRTVGIPAGLGTAISVFILVFTFSNSIHSFESIQRNPGEPILDLRENLAEIEVYWERIGEGGEACISVVNRRPNEVGENFENLEKKVEDSGDNLHLQIEAYRSAQYAYIMASDVECDSSIAKVYAQKSIGSGNLALILIEEAENTTGKYGRSLRQWLKDDFTEERIHFHNALGHALLYRWGDKSQANDVRNSLDRITRDQFYPENAVALDLNRFVAPFLEHTFPKDSDFHHPCQKTCKSSHNNLRRKIWISQKVNGR